MISTKQRAKLRAMANLKEVLVHVGKDGFTPAVSLQLKHELFAHEIVKCAVLPASGLTAREAAQVAQAQTGCDIVQIIGSKFIVYQPNPEQPVIVL